jgi:hypothetical protein
MTVNILNLSVYRVTGGEAAEHAYHVRAETIDPPSKCRESGSDLFGRGALARDLAVAARVALAAAEKESGGVRQACAV